MTTEHEARDVLGEFLTTKNEYEKAEAELLRTQKKYRDACRVAAQKLEAVVFKTKDGNRFFSKVRGVGNYAFKPCQPTWKNEDKLVVDVTDLV